LHPAMVSATATERPGTPVKASVTRERLGQEAMQAPRPLHDLPVLCAELFDAQQRDHILQLAIVLDRAANLGCDGDVLFADALSGNQDARLPAP
jgi:hypothetical protein